MKTENLTKACDSFDFFFNELRDAHKDALNSGNQFEAALFALMQEAVNLQVKLSLISEAVTKADAAKTKEPK